MDLYKVIDSLSTGYVVSNIITHERKVCKARGKIKSFNSIFIGDLVNIDENDCISNLLERSNYLLRPRLANIDACLVLISCKEPILNTFLLDQYLTYNDSFSIPSIIVFTKSDLVKTEKELENILNEIRFYEECGYKSFLVSSKNDDTDDNSIEELKKYVEGKTLCLMGQSGVGKSSLLNKFDLGKEFVEGNYEFKKQQRGQHITKKVIFQDFNKGYIADTPGFSKYDLNIDKKLISKYFPGFNNLYNKCKYNDCLHKNEGSQNCAVIKKFSSDEKYLEHYKNYLKLLIS